MRYPSYKPMFFIVIILSAALYFPQANPPAGAASAPATGDGETAAAQPIAPPLAQLPSLVAPEGAADDKLGWSVAAIGDTLVIGAYLDDVGANADQGSAYVFVRSGGGWTFQQKLVASDGAAQDRFGDSVAIYADTIVVGAPLDDIGTNLDQGAAYVFVRSGTLWSIQQKLTANDGAAQDRFGDSVAIYADTVVAGAPLDNTATNSDQGAAYVFARSGAVWAQRQKLSANDGAPDDQFGGAVAISDNTIVVGAYLDDNTTPTTGQEAAYVFARSGNDWSFQQKLVASDGAEGDHFGAAVAVNGDTAVIGAWLDDNSANADQGSAYVFARSGTGWTQQRKLTANDGGGGDRFGRSVALDGNTALVGAYLDDVGAARDQGSVYLFSRSGVSWTQRQKLTDQEGVASDFFGNAVAFGDGLVIASAPQAKVGANASQGAIYFFGCGYVGQKTITGGVTGDYFSLASAIDGDTAVVGAPAYYAGTGGLKGSAYVYTRNGAEWTLSAQLLPSDVLADDYFGGSVAINRDTIVVGAPTKNINGVIDQGAVYVFARVGGTWIQQARLVAGDGATEDYFGGSVSISNNLLAVGAPQRDVGGKKDQGMVYLFSRTGATWTPGVKLTADDGGERYYLGHSVSLSDFTLIAGAPAANVGAGKQGAAYVFEGSFTPWKQRAKLIDSQGKAGDFFGKSVALWGNTALIGAPMKAINGVLAQGAAFVFVASRIGIWSQQATLIQSDGKFDDELGLSVALSGNTAVVGKEGRGNPNGYRQGMAYVFTRNGATWTSQQPIVSSDVKTNSHYGASVAVSGETILVGAVSESLGQQGAVTVLKTNCVAPLAPIASVSAASFAAGGGLAPESITAGFGANLATSTQTASSLPLPTTLAGVSVKVTDSAAVERLAPLFFVSPGQINYQIPPGTANGPVSVMVTGAAGPIASGAAQIFGAAPGLFSANSSGQGVAAALALRIKADGSQSFEPVAQFDPAQNRFVPVPIDLGPATDQVFLVFFGTGLRYRSSLSAVNCAIGGASTEALFVGAAPGFAGLDQVNARLPRSLVGRGEVGVELFVDSKAANTVRVSIR